MSKLKEYREMERALRRKLERLEVLKNNTELIKELEFEKKLLNLLGRYSKKVEDLITFIRPLVRSGVLKAQENRPPYAARNRKSQKKTHA